MNEHDATAPPPDAPAVPPVPAPTAQAGTPRGHCENCGAPLLGDHCYACGQPVKGLVRHFSSVMGDFLDTVLQWDSRLPRTLWPLFARPAYLTREYFAGRRVRYVSPVRLFFTMSLVTFFFAQLLISFGDQPVNVGADGASFGNADTVAEVIRQRDEALKEIADARKESDAKAPGVGLGLGIAERAIRQSADARIGELKNADPTEAGAPRSDRAAGNAASEADAAAERAPAPARADAGADAGKDPGRNADAASAARTPAKASGRRAGTEKPAVAASSADASAADGDGDGDDGAFTVLGNEGESWDPKTDPITVAWLPAWANARLNALGVRAKKNIERMQKNPDDFKDAVLGAVPSTLFVLLPVFALLLKLFYVFKRRLYMEHLIVALHSHAFLCLALLLMFAAMGARDAITAQAGFFYGLLGWIEAALWVWMPLYLLLMQKRVYGQGWLMTLLKYSILGQLYFFLLTFGAVFTVMFSVVWG